MINPGETAILHTPKGWSLIQEWFADTLELRFFELVATGTDNINDGKIYLKELCANPDEEDSSSIITPQKTNKMQ